MSIVQSCIYSIIYTTLYIAQVSVNYVLSGLLIHARQDEVSEITRDKVTGESEVMETGVM